MVWRKKISPFPEIGVLWNTATSLSSGSSQSNASRTNCTRMPLSPERAFHDFMRRLYSPLGNVLRSSRFIAVSYDPRLRVRSLTLTSLVLMIIPFINLVNLFSPSANHLFLFLLCHAMWHVRHISVICFPMTSLKRCLYPHHQWCTTRGLDLVPVRLHSWHRYP